jgi:hypothetical protein
MATQPAGPLADARSAPRRPLRGTLAVLAGLAVNVVGGLGTDQILHATGVYPPWGQPMSDSLFLLATAYRVVFGIAGAYLTARLAPDRPMWHALALGVVGLVISTVGAAATWNAGPAFGPRWYPLALIPLSLACAWIGGALRVRQLRAR